MAKEYGILRSLTNTGLNSELIASFAAPLSIASNTPRFSSDTITLKKRTSQSDAQRWEITAALMPKEDPSELMIHTVDYDTSRPFPVRMPQLFRNTNIPEGLEVKVFTSAIGGDDEITLTVPSGKTLPIGEFVKFAGHSKVYLIKSAINNGDGTNKIKIKPSLRKNVVINEALHYGGNVTLTATYGEDTHIGVTYVDGVLAKVDSISLVEHL